MITYLILISCLIVLLLFRFFYLVRDHAKFQAHTTSFANEGHEPLIIKKGNDEALIIVVDPVGTAKIGQMACLIAKEVITNLYETSHAHIAPNDFLKKACFLAHRNISEKINANSGGCSIALIHIYNKQLNYASVGDIKIYLCNDELVPINELDLYKYQLRDQVLKQKINEERLLNHRLRNELTAYLGHENLKKVNLGKQEIHLDKYDKLLIATKDVYDAITPIELEKILFQKGQPNNHLIDLEQIYHEEKQANMKRLSTASAVIVSHFK